MKKKLQVISNMGLGWTTFRVKYELEKKVGLLEKKFKPELLTDNQFINKINPKFDSKDDFVNNWRLNQTPFFFSADNLQVYNSIFSNIRKGTNTNLIKEADEVCNGVFKYFSKWKMKHSPKVDWHLNPLLNESSPKDIHWTKISDLESQFGDIKYIWEMSRFSFAFTLVRAYAVTFNDCYVETFWKLFEDWIENNPVEKGVNYKCGQEMSLRINAWVFALYAFCNHPFSTNRRIFTIFKYIYHHANHIEKHFNFALKSVKNNHTTSEASGLYTVGVLFPFFDKAKKWKQNGEKYLEQEGLKHIYSDGTYLQHSMNYQRLVIQTFTWVFQLAKVNNLSFSKKLEERVYHCLMFLYNQQDEYTGFIPNYGMNDGALIHPLSNCDYLDYRPQLNCLYYVLKGERLYTSGIHDENLLWMAGKDSLNAKQTNITRKTISYPIGGYFTIRSRDSFSMTRCATYLDRPGQADMLHFDLWWKGQNVLCDAGTYSYNTDNKWLNYFVGTASHNSIMIDNKNQMERGSRFIWLNWTKSKLNHFYQIDNIQVFEGEHYGYKPLCHRRGILNIGDCWVVVDDIFGDFNNEQHSITQQWLTAIHNVEQLNDKKVVFKTKNGNFNMEIFDQSFADFNFYLGDENLPRGWRSLYYGEKIPAHQIVGQYKTNKSVRFISAFYPEGEIISFQSNQFDINGNKAELNEIGHGSIFSIIN